MNKLKIITSFFPAGKKEWKKYFKIAIPIIISGIIIALNGVVDNVMAGGLSGDKKLNTNNMTALSLFGRLSAVYNSFITSFLAVSASIIAQQAKVKNYQKIHTIFKNSMIIVLIFFSIIYLINWIFLGEIYKTMTNNVEVIESANNYSRIFVLSFLPTFLSMPIYQLLSAQGKTKYLSINSASIVVLNVSLNFLFINFWQKSLLSLSLASLIASFFINFILIIVIYFKEHQILSGFFKNYEKGLWSPLFVRIHVVFFYTIWSTIMIFRQVIWSNGDDWNGLKSAEIFASMGGIQNIFLSMNAAGVGVVAYFVGSEIGKGNFKTAQENAKKVLGFALIVGLTSSILTFITSTFIFEIGIFNIKTKNINEARWCLRVIAFFAPFWIMAGVMAGFLNSGGRNGITSIASAILGIGQTSWALLLVYLHNEYDILNNFSIYYFLFFVWEIVNITTFFLLTKKVIWLKKIEKVV